MHGLGDARRAVPFAVALMVPTYRMHHVAVRVHRGRRSVAGASREVGSSGRRLDGRRIYGQCGAPDAIACRSKPRWRIRIGSFIRRRAIVAPPIALSGSSRR